MLSDAEAHGFERWVTSAQACADSAQGYVGASTELATVSRDLADNLDRDDSELRLKEGGDDSLALALRALAAAIEEQSKTQRDGHLLTEETLAQLRMVAGLDGEPE